MEPMKPSIGRIVHFHADDDAPAAAAIVVGVHSETCVDLSVWYGGSWCSRTSVDLGSMDAKSGASQWRWPPRV